MNSKLKIFVIICLVIVVGLLNQVIGQEQNTVQDTIQTSPKPTALDLAQIPEFGKRTRSLVSDIQQLVSNKKGIIEISRGIEEVVKTLDEKLLIVNDTIIKLSTDRLEKEERELTLLNERIIPWKKSILDISRDCGVKDSIINSMSQVWQLTLESMSTSSDLANSDKANTSGDLKLDVANFITELNTSQLNLAHFADTLRYIQTEIAFAENKLGNITSIIESKKEALNQNIWIPESPPIWQVKKDTIGINIISRYTNAVSSDRIIAQTFLKNNPKMPYYVLLLFVLIFGVILYLKTNSEKLYADFQKEPKDVNFVLRNPFLTSLLILWFGSLLFSFFPKELNDLISLAMLGPLVLILYRLNDHWKWYSAVVFSLTYLLFLIVKDLDYSYLQQRFFLIFINGFSLFLFMRFKKQKDFVKESNKFWFGTFSFVIQFFIFAGSISIFANIFGSIRLAQLISFVSLGMIVSIYALHAAVILARNLVFLILMGPFVKHSNILKEDSEMVLIKMDKLFRLIGFISLVVVFLNLFGIRTETIETARNIINYQLKVGEMSVSLGNIIAFILTLQISIWLSNLIRYVLEKEVFPRSTKLKPGVPNTISLMIKFTFALFGILLAFSAAGIQMDKLTILMGALGVGIGFGLQNIIANFVSGIILALERPITIGDIIDIPGASGYVQDIGLRASTVYTWDGSHVIVPNGELVSNKLTNWTFHNRLRRVKVEVRVPFDTDMEALSKLLLDTAITIPEVMKKPKAYLNFKGIGQSAMEMDLFCWTNDSDKIFTYGTAIRKAIYKALRDAGYEIPVPVQDVKIGNERLVDKKSTPIQDVKIEDKKSSKTIKPDSKK